MGAFLFHCFLSSCIENSGTTSFSMNALTVLCLWTISSPLTPHFYNTRIIGLKGVWIRSGRGNTCLMPMEGGTGGCWKLSLPRNRERAQVGEVSILLLPSCPDWMGRRVGNTASNAGKQIKEFGDSHTTHKQVNKGFINAYSSVTIKIIKSEVFFCYLLEIVLYVSVFILINLFWNFKLLFILIRSCPLNIDLGELKLNNDHSNRNSFWPDCWH